MSSAQTSPIKIQVWDWNFLDTRDFLGECSLPPNVYSGSSTDATLPLSRGDVEAGSIQLMTQLYAGTISEYAY